MFEIYIFVNPLDSLSLEIEKKIIALAEKNEKKIHFRFIPVVNMRSIKDSFVHRGEQKISIGYLNHVFEVSYSSALDLKAIQLQGRKKGREFLLALQEEISENNRLYDKDLVLGIVEKIGGDVEMFISDRQSDLVKRAFISNQQTAREMGVHVLPSGVVYNFEEEEDGLLFEENIIENILHFFQQSFDVVIDDEITKGNLTQFPQKKKLRG